MSTVLDRHYPFYGGVKRPSPPGKGEGSTQTYPQIDGHLDDSHRKEERSAAERLTEALRELKATNPIVWKGINEAYQALVDKSLLHKLSATEEDRLESLGQALDSLVEPYDLARIAMIEEKRRGG